MRRKLFTLISGVPLLALKVIVCVTLCVVASKYAVWVSTPLAGWLLLRAILYRPPPAAGCCRACGYDCRATPARCPECGAEPT